MRKLILAGFALALSAMHVSAADLGPYGRGSIKDAPAPVYAPAGYNWSGLYLGAQVGYGWGTSDARSGVVGGVLDQSYSYNTNGFLGGLHAGYNWQLNSFLFGVETDIEASGVNGSGTGSQGSTHSTDLNWLGSLRARIGLPAGNTLFYATGGLAYGNVDIRSEAVSYSDWRTGWTLGGGIEQAFTPTMTARLEYRYTDLGTFSDNANSSLDRTDLTSSAIRAGLSFKF